MGNKVKSVFRRREVEKVYVAGGSLCYERSGQILSEKQLGEYEIDAPLLEKGDMFYLSDIQEEVVIESQMRGSDGSTVYYAKDKLVETENTRKTYLDCMEKIKEYDHRGEKIKELENDLRQLKESYWEAKGKLKKLEDSYKWYRDKYKYEHRFFNSKYDQIKFIDESELSNK